MITTRSDYQNVLTWLGLKSPEQRREPRVSVEAKLAVVHSDQTGLETTVSVIARDLTPEGVGIASETPMAIGQQFILHLDNVEPLRIVCQVRHCRVVGPNRFHIGASFAD